VAPVTMYQYYTIMCKLSIVYVIIKLYFLSFAFFHNVVYSTFFALFFITLIINIYCIMNFFWAYRS
jgi:hypothetical protein